MAFGDAALKQFPLYSTRYFPIDQYNLFYSFIHGAGAVRSIGGGTTVLNNFPFTLFTIFPLTSIIYFIIFSMEPEPKVLSSLQY